jgi:hypothetical protein
MAIKYFSSLTPEETDQLMHAPAIVTVLIAGADENIDRKEKGWAERLIHYRTFTSDPKLHDYYVEVNETFVDQLESLIASWKPQETEAQLTAKLSVLKDVLAKLDPEFADLLKNSWRSMAKKVAEASGGLVGFSRVHKREAALIDLPMLD